MFQDSRKNLPLFKRSKSGIFLFTFVVFVYIPTLHAFPKFASNDAFSFFSWIRNKTDTYNFGYNLVTTIDSSQTRNDSLIVAAKVQVNNMPEWLKYVKNSYGSLNITFSGSKPSNVVSCSPAYNSCPWLLELKLNLDNEKNTIRFPFPVPDQNAPYHKYDYFTIAVNDSVHLQFQGVLDSIFMGSFINYKRFNEPEKRLMAKAAIMVSTSKSAPFKIHSIELNANYKDLITSYLGTDLSRLSTSCDFYGMDFMESVDLIRVSNLNVSGSDTLIADSTYKISWTTENKKAVQVCSLYVSFDNDTQWVPMVKITDTITEYSWLVPNKSNKSCKFMVRATGANEEKASCVSKVYAIKNSESNNIDEVINSFQLMSLSDTSQIRLIWESVIPVSAAVESIGIFMCNYRYPVRYNDSEATLVRMFPAADSTFLLVNLKAGQTWYFALMVKDTFGNWSNPTDQSVTRAHLSVRNGTSNVAKITPDDTLHLFNDSLQIWNTSGLTFTDTVDSWNGPANGFIVASRGYVFLNGDKMYRPIWIKVPYLKTFKSQKPAQILLYSYDIFNSGWLVSTDSVKVDTIAGSVSAVNSKPGYPFMFLIDTQPPVITHLTGNKNPVKTSQRITDTVSVKDNVKNFAWNFFGGPGKDASWDLSMYVSTVNNINSSQLFRVTTPPGIADSCSGLRSVFTVSDGAFTRSISLSRAVLRESENSDNFTVKALQWTPVMVSARPEHAGLKSVIGSSSGIQNWTYDSKEMRIIKWIPDHPKAFGGGWVEYNNVVDTFFNSKSGSFYWIKTQKPLSINFGSAVIPQIGDTSTITFAPGQWADFSNPFPFDIYIGDMLQSTSYKTKTKSADSLEFYSWNQSNGSYKTTPVYLAAMPGLTKLSDTIKSTKPYTVFNPGKNTVTLFIPPVCVPASFISQKEKSLAKRENIPGQWSICVNSWGPDNVALPSLYLGQNSSLSKEITYSKSPSFSQQRITVYDCRKKETFGSIVSPQKSESGNYFELLFENDANLSVTIRSSVGKMFSIDQSLLMQFYDPDKDIWIDAYDTIEQKLNSKQKTVRVFAIGNEQYFRDLGPIVRRSVLALRAVYPNPFTRALTVQYSLPYGAQKVSFFVYNLLGQVMWKKEIADIRPGPSFLKMDKQLATGIYVIQMRVKIEGNGSPKVLNREVMCIR